MQSKELVLVIVLLVCCATGLAVPTRIFLEKCGTKGFSCPLSDFYPSRHDIIFECNNVTTQDVQFYLWQFNALATVASFTIQKCERVQISFTCTGESKPIQWLKVQDVGVLEIIPSVPITHNPPEIYFENISNIEKLPANTFSQLKYNPNKGGCFVPLNDSHTISFKNLNIGTIHTDAFSSLQLMRKLSWNNVSVNRIETRAVNITFESGGCTDLKSSNLGVIEPLAFLITGERLTVTRCKIADIWTSGFNGTIYDVNFSNNTVLNIQAGAISILSQNTYIINNHFKKVQTGSFRKISPGLVHDSRRQFSNLKFVYFFNNNMLDRVGDGSFRPDIVSYRNVNANVWYSYNTLPCSCEGLAWLKDDVKFGHRYSVIREFNNMLLDPENSNICSFTPCTCFGGTPQEKIFPKPAISSVTKRTITFIDDDAVTNLLTKPE